MADREGLAERDPRRGELNSQAASSSGELGPRSRGPADSSPAAPRAEAPREASPAPTPAGSGPVWLDQYRLDRVVGAGGMGVVHDAWDDALKRRVAVKVLAHGASTRGALERFRQEATLAGRLRHPNIVVVHEAGEANGRAYIAMEFVEGRTLEDEIHARTGDTSQLADDERERQRRQAVAKVDSQECKRLARLVRDVARALHAGHAYVPPGETDPRPIIHRDVKPGNVIVDRAGVPKLLDYGLAKEVGLTLTFSREAVGTPLFMSPEQLFSSKRVGPRTDVYSLGMTLYACLTLARPFELSQPGKLFEHLLHDDPTAVRKLNPQVPEDLETIVRKATEKDERNRYASALALAEDLDAFLEDRPIRAKRPGLHRTLRRFLRRHATLTTVALLLALGAGGVSLKVAQDDEEAVQAARAADEQKAQATAEHLRLAETAFEKATLLFELASLANAEDPQSARWLQLLNQGHDLEAEGTREQSAAGVPAPASLERAHLLARVAQNDPAAASRLTSLARQARDARTRAQSGESAVAWLARRATEPDRPELLRGIALARNPATRLRPARQQETIDALVALFPRLTDFDPQADPDAEVARILRLVGERHQADVALAAGAETFEAALATLKSEVRLAVAWPSAERRSGQVEIVRQAPGDSPDQGTLVARGAPGEVLVAPAGDLVIQASEPGARPIRVALRASRSAWGSAQEAQAVRLPVAPSRVPAGMVLVTTGQRDGFFLDAAEVSNARYAGFVAWVKEHGHERCCPRLGPAARDRTHAPVAPGSLAPDAPVTGITWDDARAFAAWSEARLPSREEWLAAATQGHAPLARANFRGAQDGWLWASPAEEGPTATCGARNLLGNVAEWVACSEDELPWREAVGGGWSDEIPADPRALVARYARDARGADLGFRCARSLPEEAARAPVTRPARIEGQDGAPLVLVPGGKYRVVSWTVRERSGPAADVELRPFYVDATPVTNERFDAFLRARGLGQPYGFGGRLRSQPRDPAVAISWTLASAYAAWAGKRLPTEAEWCAAQQVRPAGFEGGSPDGGGLAEWCADVWAEDFWRFANRRAPCNRWAVGAGHVLRFLDRRVDGLDANPEWTGQTFRCVQDVPPEDGP